MGFIVERGGQRRAERSRIFGRGVCGLAGPGRQAAPSNGSAIGRRIGVVERGMRTLVASPKVSYDAPRLPGAFTDVEPLFRVLARRARRKGVDRELEARYCR